MSMFTTTKATKPELTELVAMFLKNGGEIKRKRDSKPKLKTFLNYSNRGAKAYTLRNAGYAKATA